LMCSNLHIRSKAVFPEYKSMQV